MVQIVVHPSLHHVADLIEIHDQAQVVQLIGLHVNLQQAVVAVEVAALASIVQEAVAVAESMVLVTRCCAMVSPLTGPPEPAKCLPESTRMVSPVMVSLLSRVTTSSAISSAEDSRRRGARSRTLRCQLSGLMSGAASWARALWR